MEVREQMNLTGKLGELLRLIISGWDKNYGYTARPSSGNPQTDAGLVLSFLLKNRILALVEAKNLFLPCTEVWSVQVFQVFQGQVFPYLPLSPLDNRAGK